MTRIFFWNNGSENPQDNEEFKLWRSEESGEVHWDEKGPWEPAIWDCDHLDGHCSEAEWLDSLGVHLSGDSTSLKRAPVPLTYGVSRKVFVGDAVDTLARRTKGDEFHHAFLDSFSIIENGERARRVDRLIEESACQTALIECVRQRPDSVNSMTPREFEVLVAHTLKGLGFSSVTLRRYSKDSGVDILAVMASSTHVDELVVVEVKHGRTGITLAVLDRLNGVRDRFEASRALAIASARVTRYRD